MASTPNIANFRQITGTKCFRSSKVDPSLAPLLLDRHNIKTILDLRNDNVDTIRPMSDGIYPVFTFKTPFTGGEPQVVSMLGQEEKEEEEVGESGRRRTSTVKVPLCSFQRLFTQSPWYLRIFILICDFIDGIFGTRLGMFALVNLIGRPLGKDYLSWIYQMIILEHGPEIAAMLRYLSLPQNVPAAVMCSLGKDRTGVISALLSHTCGVPQQQIIQDYSLSQELLPDEKIASLGQRGLHPSSYGSAPEYMERMLEFIDQKYGSTDGYLESIGFTGEEQDKLRKNIISRD